MSSDRRWELAFWIITAICGVWLAILSTNVIANDRMRATEDVRLITERNAAILIINTKLDEFIKCNNSDHQQIMTKLTRIETLQVNGR